MTCQIRELTTLAEMQPIEDLQRDIWGYGAELGPPYPYPARCFFEFAESGGLIAGAYDELRKMVGFSAAWIGRDKSTSDLYLHSQLIGVKEQYRNSQVGYSLKLHQRDCALRKGLRFIRWTFDPLQTRNAYLNLAKLGARVERFIPNYYGALGGKQNQTLPADRFWAVWDITEIREKDDRLGPQDVPRLPAVNVLEGPDSARTCHPNIVLSLNDPQILVEMPLNLQEIRSRYPELALDWQNKSREIFTHYLSNYAVVDAIVAAPSFFYVLARKSVGRGSSNG